MTKSDPPTGSAPSRRLRAALIALGGLGAVTVGCDDPEVRYGPVGGLRARGTGEAGGSGPATACEYPDGTDTTGATCPDWETVIFPLFDSPQYGCTSGGICHGSNTGELPRMPAGDPAASYQAMADFTLDGRPYIGEGLQEDAYLLCNIWLDTPTPFGVPMPVVSGAVVPIEGDDLLTIANWVACGMPETGGAIGGAGGGGGIGGAGGGIGGAGGGL